MGWKTFPDFKTEVTKVYIHIFFEAKVYIYIYIHIYFLNVKLFSKII